MFCEFRPESLEFYQEYQKSHRKVTSNVRFFMNCYVYFVEKNVISIIQGTFRRCQFVSEVLVTEQQKIDNTVKDRVMCKTGLTLVGVQNARYSSKELADIFNRLFNPLTS